MKYYKISCEYFIQAEDKNDARSIVNNEDDFIETHVMITECTDDEYEDIENGLEIIENKLDK